MFANDVEDSGKPTIDSLDHLESPVNKHNIKSTKNLFFFFLLLSHLSQARLEVYFQEQSLGIHPDSVLLLQIKIPPLSRPNQKRTSLLREINLQKIPVVIKIDDYEQITKKATSKL